MEQSDVLIIGAGLFGTIIGDWLLRGGRSVAIVDAERQFAGSKPAACLMKPSWLNTMSRAEQAQSMGVLDKLYGVQDLSARVNFGKHVKVHWVPPAAILGGVNRYFKATVVAIGEDFDGPWYYLQEANGLTGEKYRAKTIIVAAGIWSDQLVMVPNLSGSMGVAFTWKGISNYSGDSSEVPGLPPPAIKVWAPYKQVVSLQRAPDELWCGDGTAVKQASMDKARIDACLKRCAEFVGMPAYEAQHLIGIRPTIKGMRAPAWVERVDKNIWVATGGAKNGTAGAGWAAYRLGEVLL